MIVEAAERGSRTIEGAAPGGEKLQKSMIRAGTRISITTYGTHKFLLGTPRYGYSPSAATLPQHAASHQRGARASSFTSTFTLASQNSPRHLLIFDFYECMTKSLSFTIKEDMNTDDRLLKPRADSRRGNILGNNEL